MSYKLVEVDLDEWDDDELLEELTRRRGYGHDLEAMRDDVFELYKLWIDDKGDRDNRFEKALRKFFAKHLNKVNV